MQHYRTIHKISAAGLALALFAAFSGPVLAQKVPVGQASSIVRTVEGAYESDVRQLAVASQVFQNENVSAKTASAAKIRFADDTVLTIGPDSTLTLDAFVYDPAAKNSKMVLNSALGVARFVTGRMGSPAYQIKTPTATIGVRGTILIVSVGKLGETNVITENGVAVVTGASGNPVDVPAGMWSNVPPGGDPSGPAPPDPEVEAGVAEMDVTLLLGGGEDSDNDGINDDALQALLDDIRGLRDAGCGC